MIKRATKIFLKTQRTFCKKTAPYGLEYIDDTEFFDNLQTTKEKTKVLAENIVKSQGKTLLFTGAGMSTSCGVPDYRSGYKTFLPTGPGKYESDTHKEIFNESKKAARLWADDSMPSLSHQIVKQLYNQKYIHGVVNQNVDGIFTMVGLDNQAVIDLHGNILNEYCTNTSCNQSYQRDFSTIKDSNKILHYAGRNCFECGEELNDDLVYFGETLNIPRLKQSIELCAESNYFLILGSSLTVHPIAEIGFLYFKSGKTCVVNQQKTLFEQRASKINAICDATMALVATHLGIADFSDEVEQIFESQNKKILENDKKSRSNIILDYIDLNSKKNYIENYDHMLQFCVGSKKYNDMLGDNLSRKVTITKSNGGLKINSFNYEKNTEVYSIKEIRYKTTENHLNSQKFDATKQFFIPIQNFSQNLYIEIDFYKHKTLEETINLKHFLDNDKLVLDNKILNFFKFTEE